MSDDLIAQLDERYGVHERTWGDGWDGVEGCYFVSGPEIPPFGVQSPHGVTVIGDKDARLIADAPTLLAALRAVLAVGEATGIGELGQLRADAYNMAIDKVRRVIGKSLGATDG